MTTLAIKTNVAQKIIAAADLILGPEQSLKCGRFWYKGQQNCDLVLVRQDNHTIVQASGGVRFRIAIEDRGSEAGGTLALLGWLRETPNAIRIVTTLLKDFSGDVARRREQKLTMISESLRTGAELPEFTEALGSHFSIKADEDKLEAKHWISAVQSERNFAMAVKSRWYHQGFVNFCQAHGIKCYYRSVFGELDMQPVLPHQGAPELLAQSLQ